MNKIPNRAAICEVLMEQAKTDKDIVVLCSDSRGSASLTSFANAYPKQFVEVGIAEQNLVSISAGLAKTGKKVFCASPASFLSTRSYEQAKVDVAYSNTNVKLIGISGGVSYGALGMSHHSAQDIAAMSAIPNMRVYLPSDHHQTRKLVEALLRDKQGAYIRVGWNPVEDIYTEDNCPFVMNRATVLAEGTDVLLVACGEMVRLALCVDGGPTKNRNLMQMQSDIASVTVAVPEAEELSAMGGIYGGHRLWAVSGGYFWPSALCAVRACHAPADPGCEI